MHDCKKQDQENDRWSVCVNLEMIQWYEHYRDSGKCDMTHSRRLDPTAGRQQRSDGPSGPLTAAYSKLGLSSNFVTK
jgi:hypothetical protein